MPKGVVSLEKRCQGKNQAGERCGRAAVPGRNFCRFHGGHAKVGKDNPNYKDGKYSKYFPKQLRERYHEFLEHPDLITNRQEIAALEVRLSQLIDHVEEDVSVRTFSQLTKMWRQLMFAIRSNDGIKQAELIGSIDEFIENRADQDKSWGDIERVAETRRKLADSEQRRLVQMNQMLTVEQAMTLMLGLIASVKDVVHLYADPTAARHIIQGTSDAYVKLIGISSPTQPNTIDPD